MHGLLKRVAAAGTAVVLSSHRMDDLEQLCSQVTVLNAGRAVFTGPIGKLATESGPLDHRLSTSDDHAARRVLRTVREAHEITPEGSGPADTPLLVRAARPALDELVFALARAGVAVRELGPVVSPLESAFLNLTEAHLDHHTDGAIG